MAFSLRAMLVNPSGGQRVSAAIALVLLTAVTLFLVVSTVVRFFDGSDNWWLGLAPSILLPGYIYRSARYLRSRNAR